MNKMWKKIQLVAAAVTMMSASGLARAEPAKKYMQCTCGEAAEAQAHAQWYHCPGGTCAVVTYCDTWWDNEYQYIYYEADCWDDSNPICQQGIGGGC